MHIYHFKHILWYELSSNDLQTQDEQCYYDKPICDRQWQEVQVNYDEQHLSYFW